MDSVVCCLCRSVSVSVCTFYMFYMCHMFCFYFEYLQSEYYQLCVSPAFLLLSFTCNKPSKQRLKVFFS